MPAKIEVTSGSTNPVKGGNVEIHIKLLDAENRPAVANKDFEIEVVGHSQKGLVETSKILIKAGETAQATQLALKDAGVIELTASNKQLAQGGAVVNVRASGSLATPAPSIAASPGATMEPNLRSLMEGGPLNTGSAGPEFKETPTPAPQHPGGEAMRRSFRARSASESPARAMALPPPPPPREPEPSPATAGPSPVAKAST